MAVSENKLVSIIIPAYNYGAYIGECLNSVLGQSYPHWECIVVDNGSTDNTAGIVTAYAEKDKRIHYHFTAQNGVSRARNLAVSLSAGQYILPLDADDKIAPAYLEKGLKHLQQHPEIKVVYCDAELFGAASGKWALPEYSLHDLLIENSIFCSALYRRSDFDATGGYNENMKEGFEDWDFWISMLKRGGNVYKIPEVLFYYRIRQASRNSSLDHEKQLRLRQQIYENHRALYDATFRLPDLLFKNNLLAGELKNIKQSGQFKAGKLATAPWRLLRKILKGGRA